MWSICKKELRQFFSGLTGYIAIIVFLLVNGLVLFVFTDNIFDFGYATLDKYFRLAPWVLILLIPAITMRSFSDEFKTGTFELLQTRPLSKWQIVLGKYLGCLLVVVIALLPTIVYIFSIQALSVDAGIDTGATIGAYIGLFFLAAVFAAVGLCCSSYTTNAVVAFIIAVVVAALLYYGFDAISSMPVFENGPDYYIALAGIDFHYKSISRGVIDSRDIIYFLTVIFFLLCLTYKKISSGEKKLFAQFLNSKFSWLGLLLQVAVFNFIASTLYARIDLTREKRYTLSTASRKIIESIDSNVEVTVFLKGDFPSGFRKLVNSTEEFLRLMQDVNGSKIHFNFISPQEKIKNTATSYGDSLIALGALPINLTVQKSAEQRSNIIFPVALISYKGKQSLVNLYPGASNRISQEEINSAEALMEYQFVSALHKLSQNQTPSVAYSTGNGQPTDGRTYQLSQTLMQHYRFGTLDINQAGFIPGNIDVLMIVKPSITFTEEEKFKIDQFVMRGGKLLCFIDNLYAEQDSLAFKPETIAYDRNLNLTELFFRYGLRINTDLVMDLQCDAIPLIVGGNAQNPQFAFLGWNYYPFLLPAPNQSISKNLGYVNARFANSIDTIKVEGIAKSPLLVSSPNARTISTPALISLNENRDAPQDEKFTRNAIPVAMLLEGRFTSLYKNRASRTQLDSLEANGLSFSQQSVNNKMIVVADGDMVFNDINKEEGPLPIGWNNYTYTEYQNEREGGRYFIPVANKDFLLNCIEYLTGDLAISELRNKDIVLRLLDSRKIKAEGSKWQLLNIVLPILLIIIFGWVYNLLRKKKYAH